jgi:hypothetical protein
MKKLAILWIAFLLTLTAVQGATGKKDNEKANGTGKELKSERVAFRNLSGGNVSTVSSESFSRDFPEAKEVTAKRFNVFDEFHFTAKNGDLITAFYDDQGNLVGTSQRKSFSDLPADAQREINTRYKDYTIGNVIFYDDNESNETDMNLYGIQFNDVDSYFVELGKGNKIIALQVLMDGQVLYFTDIK